MFFSNIWCKIHLALVIWRKFLSYISGLVSICKDYRHERVNVPVEHSAYIANYLFKYKNEDFEIMKIIKNVQFVKTVNFYARPLPIIKKGYLIIDNTCLFRKRFFLFFSVWFLCTQMKINETLSKCLICNFF